MRSLRGLLPGWRWKRCAAGRPIALGLMNRTDPHPIEVLLVVAWLAVEAACHLLAALVALALALLPQQRPGAPAPARQTGEAAAPQQEGPPSPIRVMTPAPHPLAVLAEQLTTTCTRRELQAMAGTRSNLSKAALAGMVAACS